MTLSLSSRAAIVSLLLLCGFLAIWHIATRGTGNVQQMSPEYAKLMGLTATQDKSAMPGPLSSRTTSTSPPEGPLPKGPGWTLSS